MITFAIPDLHGRYDLLCKALSLIESSLPSGRVVFLGDYIDRGPESKQVLDRLMQGPADGWVWICLKGNHEDIMRQGLANKKAMEWWLKNGGVNTLYSFGLENGATLDRNTTAHMHPYVEWCNALPSIYVDDHRIYVHAGLKDGVPLTEHSDNEYLWHRYSSGEGWHPHTNRHVVHGHTASRLGPQRLGGRTNLDGMAYETGKLFVGVFDDEVPGGPLRIVEISQSDVDRTHASESAPVFYIGTLGPNDEN